METHFQQLPASRYKPRQGPNAKWVRLILNALTKIREKKERL